MVSIYTLRKERDLEETLSFTLTPQKGDEPDDKDGED